MNGSNGARHEQPHNDHHGQDGGPLKVLICGAGIGGLTAALALRQQGHHVTLFESSKFSNETGAAIHIAPNCNGLLLRMGLDIETIGANEMLGFDLYAASGKKLNGQSLKESRKQWLYKWLLVHRAHLHTALRKKATEKAGEGSPATLVLGNKVVAVDPENAQVTLESGEKVAGDVLIGADGVHSQCRTALVGGDKFKPFDGGDSAFRFLIPKEDLMADSRCHEFISPEGTLVMIVGEDRRVVVYPCVNNTLMNFLLIHPSKLSRSEDGGWNQRGDKKQMLEIAGPFGENVKAMLEKAPEDTLKVWTLLDMDVIPDWTNGNMAILGDAAHPFLPHQAQGGAQAMEDAISLAAVLPLGTPKDQVADRLKLYQKCRKERADKIQQFTRLSGKGAKELEATGQKLNPLQFTLYNFGHDEWDHSTNMLNKHLWSKQPYRYRQPVAFGPSPGPRQPQNQLPDVLSYSRQHQDVATIRFKTSRTYLQNLFPNSQWSFASPGTVAQASVVCCTLHNMTWLGDTGYTHCGLYIHGVKYTKRDGTVLNGMYLPILFENLSDPIITGREEIAAPKWIADINVTTTGSTRKTTMGWRGFTFMEMEHIDLGKGKAEDYADKPAKPSPEDGMLMHRYVPTVGEPGKADAEYTVFDAFPAKSAPKDEGQSKFDASSVSGPQYPAEAKLKFFPGTWGTLPTLHHIAKGLAGVPIHEILEAKVESVPSVGDVRSCKRVVE